MFYQAFYDSINGAHLSCSNWGREPAKHLWVGYHIVKIFAMTLSRFSHTNTSWYSILFVSICEGLLTFRNTIGTCPNDLVFGDLSQTIFILIAWSWMCQEELHPKLHCHTEPRWWKWNSGIAPHWPHITEVHCIRRSQVYGSKPLITRQKTDCIL